MDRSERLNRVGEIIDDLRKTRIELEEIQSQEDSERLGAFKDNQNDMQQSMEISDQMTDALDSLSNAILSLEGIGEI